MRIQHKGTITKIYKDPVDLWCVEVKRDKALTKGKTVYIGLKIKPKLKVGQAVEAGDEI